ncbi:MAG: replication factor C small subunit [Candidatus Diapherotrites archaeon]|nr:replication factor C small subunit [Candidatus Diapherotrites archaeon]
MELALPWVEKYRPKELKEVVGQKAVVERLEAYAKEKDMPHLLFSGRAGIGKTACALALANGLYGSEGRNILELNASDERGIDVIRGKIKDFAATLSIGKVPFKVIFLDESDSLTRDAQNALRRTMEKYSRTCRFILSCNYSSKLIEPIQSRCALFRFTPLGDKDIRKRLEHIAKQEKLSIEDKAYVALEYVAEGDLRRAINILQVASTLSKKVTADSVYKVSARARPEEVREMIGLALKGKFLEARKALDALLYDYALSAEDVLLQVHREVVSSEDFDAKQKVALVDRIGEASFRVSEGANERIQLEAFLAQLVLMGAKK